MSVPSQKSPGAVAEQWLEPRANVPRGGCRREKFESKILGNKRDAGVYLPADFSPMKGPYALAVVFDDAHHFPLPVVFENLIAKHLIPPLVAIAWPIWTARRKWGVILNFHDSFKQELLPWARARWRAASDPAMTIVAGEVVARELVSLSRLPIRLYLRVGTFESDRMIIVHRRQQRHPKAQRIQVRLLQSAHRRRSFAFHR